MVTDFDLCTMLAAYSSLLGNVGAPFFAALGPRSMPVADTLLYHLISASFMTADGWMCSKKGHFDLDLCTMFFGIRGDRLQMTNTYSSLDALVGASFLAAVVFRRDLPAIGSPGEVGVFFVALGLVLVATAERVAVAHACVDGTGAAGGVRTAATGTRCTPSMRPTDSSPLGHIFAPVMTAAFDLCSMPNAYTSVYHPVQAPFAAADFTSPLCPVTNAYTSFLGIIYTSFVAAFFA